MKNHEYITVGSRRWCLGCNTFQRFRGGKWRDDEELIGPWPGYARTEPSCPCPYRDPNPRTAQTSAEPITSAATTGTTPPNTISLAE